MNEEKNGNEIYFWTELDEDLNEYEYIKSDLTDKMYSMVHISKEQKVPINSKLLKEEIPKLINTFGSLMENSNKSEHYIDEIQLNIAATAQGNFLVVGGSLTGGITVIIKKKSKENKI